MNSEMLQDLINSRQNEIDAYETNIVNYTMAVQIIDQMSDQEKSENAQFRTQLLNLLSTEKREQNKSKIMLQVLKKQLENIQLNNP